ncbi:cytochrome P450 [Penicillium concentricum]|uniref:Cytochrome P450 n=1 Tax=Penicillium concentricum TaxID=293559 RepID=A0A9W9S9Z7_9EURO|nr:cytochrome P450 [Penicillium concentricum]KAJ5374312.1 cytochrome P450 [Penicillium concentricum]
MMLQSMQNTLQYFSVVAGTVIILIVMNCVYQLFINPLRKYPGPKLSAVTRVPHLYHTLRGDLIEWVQGIHVRYGDAVRIAPDELSYATSEAWRGIYGHACAGIKTTEKDPRFYGSSFNGAPDIIRAGGPDHARFRRNFSHAFSDKALREQEPLISRYADMLTSRLRTVVQENPNTEVEMVRMYNLATFDIMGDLTFGDTLNLLTGTGNSDWVSFIFDNVKTNAILRLAGYYPWTSVFLRALIPQSLVEASIAHHDKCKERVDKRVNQELTRPDIWGLVMAQTGKLRLTREEMYANSQIFMAAGTETTATALSGLTYQLLLSPDKLGKLTSEVRHTFKRDSDINITTLAGMKYLNACIDEGLRIYPPVPAGMPRVTPSDGLLVCGEHVPGNTAISVSQWVTYRNPKNFTRPNEFLPERWTDDIRFASDDKFAFQPFSYGPRNCIGKNLAYHEMRLILAKVIYNFDLSLVPESVGWENQRTFMLWEKNRLLVHLKPRN